MTSLLKVGLVGFGFAGATFHAPVIAHSGRTRVAAIATGHPDKARAAYPDAAVVADFDALLGLADLDCVVIATPNDTHFDLARRALEAGKHVVVDKPVTLSSAEARTLARLAADRGLVFAPFHNRRWDGDFLTVCELVASGELGRLTLFESHFDRFRPQIRQRWREDATRGGGLLFDLGPHLIDQALVLFGRPETVGATVRARRDGAAAADFVHLVLGYANHEVILHASALAAIEASASPCWARAAATRSSASTPRKTSSRPASRPTTSSSAAAIRPACCISSTASSRPSDRCPRSTASTPSSTARWRPRCRIACRSRCRPRTRST